MTATTDCSTQPVTQEEMTLRQGLELYYQANPTFQRDRDLWVGWIRIPWADLQRHDIMHVVTGYTTDLADELQLIGFLFSSITWRRPWYYYIQSVGVFLELLGKSLIGRTFGSKYYPPNQVWRLYFQGVAQGFSVIQKIDAGIDPETVMDRSLRSLRDEYGIASRNLP